MTLRDYLKEGGLSLAEFAKKVGSSQPSMTRYSLGQRSIPAYLAVKIEEATGGDVTVEELVGTKRKKARRRKQ